MLDFLKNVDIKDETIKEMYKTLDEATIYNLKVNDENCLGIILFMKKVGINNIDELLLYKTEWFLNARSDFIKKVNNNIVRKINENYLEVNL